MYVIPSIDISQGRAVKRIQGIEGTEVVRVDPIEVLENIVRFTGKIRRVHIVDLDGAKLGKPVNKDIILRLIERAIKEGLEVEVGGGIRSIDHALAYVDKGADIVLGSVVFKDPERAKMIISNIGEDRVFVSIDVKEGRIAVSGWLETVDVDPVRYLSDINVRNIIYTCIDVEGRMKGPVVDKGLIEKLKNNLNIRNLYYAGGVRDKDDVKKLVREGFNGVIIGMAMYVKGLEHFVEDE